MPTRKTTSVLLCAALLAACQAPGTTTTGKKPATSASAAVTTASQTISPNGELPAPQTSTVSPGSPTTVKASPSPAAAAGPAVLLPPQDGGSPISGTLLIDPTYLLASGGGTIVAAGAGNFLGQNGSAIVAAGGGNFLGQNGSAIVAAGGGNVIPDAASGVVSNVGGAIVASGGGNIVAAGGGNIVAAGGGNIVAAGGGNIVAAGGGNYHVLAATASAPALTPGQQLPAAGMLISAVDLSTHQYLPVGVNAQGKPVYVVYSNAQGGYKLYLPKGLTENIMIVASAPGAVDDRSTYNVVTPAQSTAAVAIDENTALASRFLHLCLVARFAEILATSSANLASTQTLVQQLPDFAQPALAKFIADVNRTSTANGIDVFVAKRGLLIQHTGSGCDPDSDSTTRGDGDPILNDLAEQVGDIALAALGDPANVTVLPQFYVGATPPKDATESALTAIAISLKASRDATAGMLAKDPNYFKTHPFTARNDCDTVHSVTVDVKTATDPAAYLVKYYLTKNVSNGITTVNHFFSALDVSTPADCITAGLCPATPPDQVPFLHVNYSDRIQAAGYAVLFNLFNTLDGQTTTDCIGPNPTNPHDRALARVVSFCREHQIPAASADPAASACAAATGSAAASSPAQP